MSQSEKANRKMSGELDESIERSESQKKKEEDIAGVLWLGVSPDNLSSHLLFALTKKATQIMKYRKYRLNS